MKGKRFLGFIIAALVFAASAVTVYAATPARVQLDGVYLDVDAVIIEGRTLAPARAIAEALGGSVGWDGDLRQVTINHGNTHILLTIDSPTAYVNSAAVALDVPPQIVNGLTKIPVRFVGEGLGVDVQWHFDGFVIINTALGFGGTPPAAATEQQTPAFASFQQILDDYTLRLREAMPRLLDEFRAAAVGVADITALAEISVDITAALAEISVEGTAEMANLWIVHGIGSEAVYMDYAARLNAVYMEEAARISALYMELAMGGGQPATATPTPIPATVPTAQTFSIGDAVTMDNATIRITNIATQANYQSGGNTTFPLDGHVFLAVTFDITAHSPRFDNTLWLSVEFIQSATGVSGVVFDQPTAFGTANFAPNQQRTFTVFINVPTNEAITSVTITDGAGATETVNIR